MKDSPRSKYPSLDRNESTLPLPDNVINTLARYPATRGVHTYPKHAVARLSEIFSPRSRGDSPENISSAMGVPVEQLKHCRIKLSELESSQ
jgi:hypothetical protein